MSDRRITIRLAMSTDLPQACDIDYEAFSPYGTAEPPETIAKRLAVFAEGFIVLEKENILLGYATAEKWIEQREPALDEDPFTTHQPSGRIFCITAMAVRPAFWRQGYGTAILHHLIDIARQHQCQQIILETTHAQSFYEKFGFRISSKRRQADAALVVMQLDL